MFSTHLLSLTISALEHLKLISSILFDTEFNGLQDGVITFQPIAWWYGHFTKILERQILCNVKISSISIFSGVYGGCREMSCTQVCRASQALSIAVRVNFYSENICRKNSQKKRKVEFRYFSGLFLRMSQADPS